MYNYTRDTIYTHRYSSTCNCLMTFQSYDGLGKSDREPALMTVAPPSQSCDQLICIYDDCRVLQSCDHNLPLSQPVLTRKINWGSQIHLRIVRFYLTTAVITLKTVVKNGPKIGSSHMMTCFKLHQVRMEIPDQIVVASQGLPVIASSANSLLKKFRNYSNILENINKLLV